MLAITPHCNSYQAYRAVKAARARDATALMAHERMFSRMHMTLPNGRARGNGVW